MYNDLHIHAPPNYHHNFLQQFATKEHQRLTRPAPFTAKEHAIHREQLRTAQSLQPCYANETKINIAGMLKKWESYCRDILDIQNSKQVMTDLKYETTSDFLLYVCGRHKLGSWGTLLQYMRQFQQLYTLSTGQYMDRHDTKEVYKYIWNFLIPRFKLRRPNLDGKPVLNVDTLRVLITFNIAYDTKSLVLGRLCVQLNSCYQLLCYTGVRPAELVEAQRKRPKDGSFEKLFNSKVIQSTADDDDDDDGDDASEGSDEQYLKVNKLLLQEHINRNRPKALCYEDILLMKVRHPVTQQGIVVMAIKFIHHKGADRKPKPTIFYFTPTKKLIFDVILSIATLALDDKAFAVESITDAHSLFYTKLWGKKDCMVYRWKQEMLKIPVFRRIRDSTLSADEAMLYSTLYEDMGRQSLESGHEHRLTPRCARRGASNAANGDAPDSVRDQMMRHDPKFATFFSAYLNKNINFDLQHAFLEEEKHVELFRMFAHVSLTRDPRAVRDMVPEEVWNNAPPDPEILKLEEERNKLKNGRYRIEGCKDEQRIRQLTADIRLMKAQREKRIVKEYREFYFHHRPTWDIEAQARGEVEAEFKEPAIQTSIPERARVAEIFCYQSDNWTSEEILQHRIEAVQLMVAFCNKKEPRRAIQTRLGAHIEQSAKQEPKVDTISVPEPNLFPLILEPTQCPDCIGDERMPLMERKFRWCRTTRERAEHRGEAIICHHPKCKDIKLKHLDHLRAHTMLVHGVALRSFDMVNRRRLQKSKHRKMICKKK
ncbi:FluG domain-containing protein [Trichoderma barbatum]